MTDAVLNTEITNNKTPGFLLTAAGNAQPSIPIPNVVPPYTGTNVNTTATGVAAPFVGSAAGVMPLASIGAMPLSLSLNSGGQTGPASVLAAMSSGALYANPASLVSQPAASVSPVSTGNTAPGQTNGGSAPNNGGVVGSNVP